MSSSPNDISDLPPIQNNRRKNSRSPPIRSRLNQQYRSISRSPPVVTSVENVSNLINTAPVKSQLKISPSSIRSVSVVDAPKFSAEGKPRMVKSEGSNNLSKQLGHGANESNRSDDSFDGESTQELIDSLIRDGDIPEEAFLAESYYSQVDEFESDNEV